MRVRSGSSETNWRTAWYLLGVQVPYFLWSRRTLVALNFSRLLKGNKCIQTCSFSLPVFFLILLVYSKRGITGASWSRLLYTVGMLCGTQKRKDINARSLRNSGCQQHQLFCQTIADQASSILELDHTSQRLTCCNKFLINFLLKTQSCLAFRFQVWRSAMTCGSLSYLLLQSLVTCCYNVFQHTFPFSFYFLRPLPSVCLYMYVCASSWVLHVLFICSKSELLVQWNPSWKKTTTIGHKKLWSQDRYMVSVDRINYTETYM